MAQEQETATQQQGPTFGIEKLYIKDFSLEVPNAPGIFLERGEPQVDIQINNSGTPLGDGVYDAVLTVTVTAKLGEKTLFLVEVSQAGIFRLVNVPEQEIEPLLAVACPNILQPYAREAISEATVRAGFAPVLLQPINFEAIYLSRLQERQAAQSAARIATPAADTPLQ
ncbi:MAG: protein-export chaperone SecB [Zoogloeaceae bacterium]|jgi:preprotein translocase subunit SecB|nr:protein-export chaperone SecB [Zoogloeaceae bacterium]